MKNITPQELKAEIDSGVRISLLDVREDSEVSVSSLPGIVHIPLSQVSDRIAELDKSQSWVCVCRSGGRSGAAAEILEMAGFAKVRNLAGGMRAWAAAIDPSMPVA